MITAFETSISISPAVTGSWQTVDLSAYVPAGATGIVFHIINIHATQTRTYGMRKYGSTDNRTGTLDNLAHTWGMIGISTDRQVDIYISGTEATIYLTAYCDSDYVFFDNATDVSGAADAWADKNISALTGANTALAAVLELQYAGEAKLGLRKNGSTDTRINTLKNKNCFGFVIGVDVNEVFEIYGGSAKAYLVGYIKANVTMYANATDISLTNTGTFEDINIGYGKCAFIEVVSSVVSQTYALRRDDSLEDYGNKVQYRSFAILPDKAGIIEGKISNGVVDFYITGFDVLSTRYGKGLFVKQDGDWKSIIDLEALENGYISIDGSIPLDADWDIGAGNKITFRDSAVAISSQNDGHVDIDADTSIDLNGNTIIPSDSNGLNVGAGTDMKVYYDGTNGNIDTDLVAPSDLTIDCGTAKTLVLEVPVYNDANVGSLVLQTGGTLPGIVEILDNDGDATGIYTRGFAIDEQGSGSLEIPHDYKEGTNFVFHIHWGANDAPSGTDHVKWQITYSLSRDDNTFPDAVVDDEEVAYDTQYEWLRTNITTITGATAGVGGTAIKIGDQLHFAIKRIAAAGDAYAGEALAATMGIHYQCDTLGSRTITAK